MKRSIKLLSAVLMLVSCFLIGACGSPTWTDRIYMQNVFGDDALDIPTRIEYNRFPDANIYLFDGSLEEFGKKIQSGSTDKYTFSCQIYNNCKMLIKQTTNRDYTGKPSYYYSTITEPGVYTLSNLTLEGMFKTKVNTELTSGEYVRTQTAMVAPFHLIGGETVMGGPETLGVFKGIVIDQEYECTTDLKGIYDFYDSMERYSLTCTETTINVNNDLLITVKSSTIKFNVIEQIKPK